MAYIARVLTGISSSRIAVRRVMGGPKPEHFN
jgi:hypothetical protein